MTLPGSTIQDYSQRIEELAHKLGLDYYPVDFELVPNNFTYWTNWPDSKNYYHRPFSWCGSFLEVITQIKPVTK